MPRSCRAGALDVVVVEARDRLGGRVWTGEVAGAAVDLGGSWIHGPVGNPLTSYLTEAGIAWHTDGPWGSGMQIHRDDATLLGQSAATSVVASWVDFDPGEAVSDLGHEVTLSEAIDWYISDRRLTAETAEAVRYNLAWLEGGLNIGAHPDRISATGASVYELHAGGNAVLTGGYGTLVDHLAGSLEVHLETPVLAVETTDHGVIVSTVTGALRADAAVVTVPLGVLAGGAIAFSPSLPPSLSSAIARLRLSTTEKAVLRFPERWWPEDVRRLTYLSDERRFPAWADMTDHVGAPTLMAFFNPVLSDVPDGSAGRFQVAMETLETMLGPGPKPLGAIVTDWRNDPYAGGSYSHIPSGATAADMRAFHHPVGGVLHFAGEHTIPQYYGTVHGAFVSGRQVADRILADS